MKKIFLAILGLISMGTAFAQNFTSEQIKKMEKEDLAPACIIKLNGDTVYGYCIKLHLHSSTNSDGEQVTYKPYYFLENRVRFISSADFDANPKIKNSMLTEYKPSDLKGYIYDYTNMFNEYRVLETVHIKSLSYSSMEVLNGKYFVTYKRTFQNGDKLYEFYFPYGKSTLTSTLWSTMEPYTIPYPAIWFKGAEEPKLPNDLNPDKDYITCPSIAERSKNGQYTNVVSNKESGLNKLSKFLSKVDSETMNDARQKAFDDYLKTCGE